MGKRSILVVYPEMFVGGSTTSLLAFLNCIDKNEYDVDLQLYRNRGELFDSIPGGVKILPAAAKFDGKLGKLIKYALGLLSGAIIKARIVNKKLGRRGYSHQVMSEFQAKWISRKASRQYDCAIGFMENWPDRYIAFCVDANKKLGWMHSTFENIAPDACSECAWMQRVDRVVFVADNCADDFRKVMPDMAGKTITIRNIVDSQMIRQRALQGDAMDAEYVRFRDTDCFKIITVCRIDVHIKGLDRAVACAQKLKAAGKKFLWLVVGESRELGLFQQMIADAGVADCMRAIGNRMNPPPFVKEADVFCLPSRYEGKPMVITESMIIGVPPVVTRYLAAEEQIKNGVEGIIVENEEDSITEALLSCMEHDEILCKMRSYLQKHEYGNSAYMRDVEQKYLS